MKNIHVLPTDKPSRLYSKDGNHILDTIMAIDWYISSAGYKPQNIYITSDVEIKEGDWVLFENSNVVRKAVDSTFTSGVNNIRIHADKKVFKIILTTDQDLIKNGIQAIDDEFLEWFVKNPSCEEVEVEDYNSYGVDNWKYLITIPVEELKQESLVEKMIPLQLKYNLDMMKQETLEQAAEKYAKQFDYAEDSSPNIDFIEGAKWQQERSYSEEEVLEILDHHTSYLETFIYQYIDRQDMEVNEDWFEQFKKK